MGVTSYFKREMLKIKEIKAKSIKMWKATEYDIRIEKTIPKYREMQEVIVSLLPFKKNTSIKVLDLGIGTGNLALKPLQQFPKAKITGVDKDEEMLKIAFKKLKKFSSKIELIKEDFSDFLPKGKYNAVISLLSIHHLTDSQKRRLFKKISQILKPKGVFVNGDFVVSDSNFINRKSAKIEEEFMKSQGIKEPGLLTLISSRAKICAEDDIPTTVENQIKWLKQVGFNEADCIWKYFNFAIYCGLKKD